jgi:hypothetical protein
VYIIHFAIYFLNEKIYNRLIVSPDTYSEIVPERRYEWDEAVEGREPGGCG